MKWMKIWLWVFLALIPWLAKAQDTLTASDSKAIKFSLKEAQEYALQNSPAVKSAAIDLESARKKIWETTAIGLPQVTATGNYQYIFKVPEFSFGGFYDYRLLPDGTPITKNDLLNTYQPGQPVKLGVQQNFTWNISVNQLIFSGEYIVGLQASRTFKELSERNLQKTKNETKEAVAKAYYMILTGEENLSILRQNLQLIDKTLNDVTAMYKQGFVEETDVDQIRINKLNLENLVNSVTEQVQIAYRLLKFQMGIDVNQSIELTDKLDELIAMGNFKLWSQNEFDVQKNIDLKIMQTNEALSMLNLQREKSRFLPSISAFYQHQEQLKKPQFNFTIPDITGFGISWPLFTSGSRNSKVSQARLALEKATIGKNQVRDGLIIEFDQSRNAYNKALNDYLTFKENLNLADKIYRKTLLKYSQGMASGMELTQAQNQFLTTESNYYNAVLSLFNAQAKLEKLLETN